MSKVEIAQESVLDAVVDMLHKFKDASPYASIPWDRDSAVAYIQALMDDGVVYVSYENGELAGCIGFEYGPLPFNHSYFVYLEKFLYVEEKYRKSNIASKLMAFAEYDIIESNTANAILMSSLSTSPASVERWYESLGYRKVESGFIKEI